MPERVRLSRKPGARMPQGAINVARPTKWGNPYYIKHHGRTWDVFINQAFIGQATSAAAARGIAVARYSRAVRAGRHGLPTLEVIRTELAGHDLACWCPLADPCHSDVLLELANA